MIFLRNESFRGYIRLYPVTTAIIALNLIMFLLLLMNGGSRNIATLSEFGALDSRQITGITDLWRFVSSMFLHAGFEHLLFNMFALFVFAPPLEFLLRRWKYASFYLLCGIAGNLLSVYAYANSYFSVGASGAVYGIFGAYLYLILFRKGSLDEQSRKTIVIILVIGVLYSVLMPQINIYAHIGGLIAGFALLPSMIRQR